MRKEPNGFSRALAGGRLLFLDGAMGTMLQAAGMPPGTPPEKFCLANPDILLDIHKAYAEAGADIITTCTFGANACKLPRDMDVFETNKKFAEMARLACGANVFIAGDVGPTGLFARPLGDMAPEKMIGIFADQIRGLAAGGVDFIIMETQFDIAELRCAVVAARRVCRLPIVVSMTFENGVSLTGSTPYIYAQTMLNMGVDAIGTNCSLGPDQMLGVAEELLAVCPTPVLAQPNAGLPEFRDGVTIFPLDPEAYAQKTAAFAAAGVQLLGGCCGTTPEHIRKLRQYALNAWHPKKETPAWNGICLTSRSQAIHIAADAPLAIIGERINPTGKKLLAEELRGGEFRRALALAEEQISAGASVLDVNIGAPLVDEAALLPELVSLLVSRCQTPLSLDSSNPAAIEAALPFYPASCLVNSISGEKDRMKTLGPLCRDFGAPFVLLPLSGASLPIKASRRIAIVEKLLSEAGDLGIAKRLIMIDALALAVSAGSDGGRECLEMIRWCASQGYAATIGLSNISFGLPARPLLNSVFLCMAAGAGLASCIANPGAPRLGEAIDAMNALLGHDRDGQNFIQGYSQWTSQGGEAKRVEMERTAARDLYEIVLAGDREEVLASLEKELAQGKDPFKLVNDVLIPAINEVGNRYERREYFLPQLIRSAETMNLAFTRLRPLLEERGASGKRPVIVMATVEGDVHDIGKNIASLLLGNHGFEVVDAGKDVKASDIVACAKKHNACIIGLSALMTTTMARMEDTVKLVRESGLPCKIMIGGAAVTRSFAEAIGADAYCEDAVAGVAAAKRFIEERCSN